MILTRRGKIIPGLLLAILIAWVAAAYAQASTFTGKITEISKGTALGLGKHGTFFIIKLDSKPGAQFRLSSEDAVKYGVIEAAGPSEILTPKKTRGLGWNVKLTCDKNYEGPRNAPIYQVKSVERLGD